MESIRRCLWSGLEIICSYDYPKADTTLSHGSVFFSPCYPNWITFGYVIRNVIQIQGVLSYFQLPLKQGLVYLKFP